MTHHNFKASDIEGFNTVVEYTDESDNANDLTGYTAALELCDENGETHTTFTTISGELVITADQGKVAIDLTPAQVAALPIFNHYTLTVTPSGGNSDLLLNGFFSVVRDAC